MGREAKRTKMRTCKGCDTVSISTAAEFVKHVEVCQRALKAGLVLPGTIIMDRPGLTIRRVKE